jgi:hypothetical protein
LKKPSWPSMFSSSADASTTKKVKTALGLSRRVAGFEIEYLTRDGSWRRNWPLLGEDAVPRGVRLALTLADGARIDRWFALR